MIIKELRQSTGMTQTEFGDYLNIPMRTIQNWEGGQRSAPEYVVKLIEYKLLKERLIMTNAELKKNGTLIEEVDTYNNGIYLGCKSFYAYGVSIYCSVYHSNTNQYTGESTTDIIVGDAKKTLEEYNEHYFYDIGFTEDGYNKLLALYSA